MCAAPATTWVAIVLPVAIALPKGVFCELISEPIVVIVSEFPEVSAIGIYCAVSMLVFVIAVNEFTGTLIEVTVGSYTLLPLTNLKLEI